MDTLFVAIALAFSTNIDNFAVGVAYSTKSRNISFAGNLIIALLSGLSTGASMFLGNLICQYLPSFFSQGFGSCLLITIGCFSIWEQVQHHFQPQLVGVDNSPTVQPGGTLSHQDSLLLGLGLTVSNLGTGIGAGMANISIGLVTTLSIATSIMMISGGTMLGKAVLKIGTDNRVMGWLTGLGLIVLGTYEAIA